MKKFSVILSIFLLASCGTTSISISTTSNPNSSSSENTQNSDTSTTSNANTSNNTSEEEIVENVDLTNAAIMHAANWSMDKIQGELANIYKAGYKAIQISPLQPSKSTDSGWAWYNLYQPLGFKVADYGENLLGDKNSLKSLTNAAKAYGIDIIADVVSNHLAESGHYNLDGNVKHFESDIYNNWLIHDLQEIAGDDNVRNTVQGGCGGLPDLKTESNVVQNRAISLIKEYIDCGVRGFRFDAAKHIETPDDGDYASNYWPNVIKVIKDYGKQKLGKEGYIYGEVLYKPGNGRKWSSYTKLMDVTDSNMGTKVTNAVKNNNMNFNYDYSFNDASKAVLWAESHDTFLNGDGETREVDGKTINLSYVIQASRKDSSVLYYVRPTSNYTMRIDNFSNDYKSNLISAANKFHNDFMGASESLSNNDNVFVNVRKNGSRMGAVIASPNTSSKEVYVNLPNGSYKDLITNKTYNVSNNKVNVTFTNGAVILSNYDGGSGDIDVKESKELEITNVPDNLKLALWVWDDGKDGSFYDFNVSGSTYKATLVFNNYLIVKMDKNKTNDWNNVNAQTDNLYHPNVKVTMSYNDIRWK